MKNIRDFILEHELNESKNQDLVKDIIDKFDIKVKKDKDSAQLAIDKLIEFCDEVEYDYPTIDKFSHNFDAYSWMSNEYSRAELKKICLNDFVISVRLGNRDFYNWNNDDKCWEEA